jgi:asparagine synthase (glutamine-hydrolysing)
MCGICGEIEFGGHPQLSASQSMAKSMHSRGPDSQGYFSQDHLALGHVRLSIIDVENTSQQPMIDSELGLAIVFNGCIYNYKELREQLRAKGYRFFSGGDTEVILKAFHVWGEKCVERFHGMFAFAIWERESGRVTFARDRLGVKPLYLAETKGRLRFASTLPALLAAGDVDTSIDPAGLHNYMSLHAVVPAPRTILKGITKLPPATILTVDRNGKKRTKTFWSLSVRERQQDRAMTEQEWKEATLEALSRAVERRRVADVPVGVLLSGGLDSSLVVGLMAKAGHIGLNTFAIGFESIGDLCGDEFKYSDLVAKHYGTKHHQIRIDASRMLTALPGAIAAMSEPMMSHDSVGFYLLSQEVSKHVKVVQSGQGADEIFAGYHWYPPLMDSNDVSDDYRSIYFDRDHAEMRETLDPSMVSGDYSSDFIDNYLHNAEAPRPLDKVLELDQEIMLVDDPVKRVDNMTMAFGLEARVPFLDHELVELAGRIPAELKVRDGGKYVLKEAARDVIPSAVIDRPKGYFPVPALKYLRGPYRDFVRDILNEPVARKRGLFNRDDYVDRLLCGSRRQSHAKGPLETMAGSLARRLATISGHPLKIGPRLFGRDPPLVEKRHNLGRRVSARDQHMIGRHFDPVFLIVVERLRYHHRTGGVGAIVKRVGGVVHRKAKRV